MRELFNVSKTISRAGVTAIPSSADCAVPAEPIVDKHAELAAGAEAVNAGFGRVSLYGSEYVTPVVNWSEFFLNPGGGSFRNVSNALTFRLRRLYSAMATPAPAFHE